MSNGMKRDIVVILYFTRHRENVRQVLGRRRGRICPCGFTTLSRDVDHRQRDLRSIFRLFKEFNRPHGIFVFRQSLIVRAISMCIL